jgi:hypothetical protein
VQIVYGCSVDLRHNICHELISDGFKLDPESFRILHRDSVTRSGGLARPQSAEAAAGKSLRPQHASALMADA